MIRWPVYRKMFAERYNLLKGDFLVSGAVECKGGPSARSTLGKAPWRVEWGVIFGDGYYFRVKESFRVMGYPHPGAGERAHFSFHYGKAHPELDVDGYPRKRIADNPPVPELRIDLDRNRKPHLHVGSKAHIYQHRIDGYTIEDAEMFRFLEAVRDHRKSKTPLLDLLGIRIK